MPNHQRFVQPLLHTRRALRHGTLALALLAAATAACADAATLPTPGHEAFENAVRQAISPAVAPTLAQLKVLHLAGDVGPWLDTGLDLQPGQQITLLMSGQFHWSRALSLGLPPSVAVWAQVGEEGEVFRGQRDTHSFVAQQAGRLRLKLFPGLAWLSPQGRYAGEPAAVNTDAGGGISVAVLAWKPGTDVAAQLQALSAHAPLQPWAQGELARLQSGSLPPPQGWRYLWALGASEIFSRGHDHAEHGPVIDARTRNDVGILQKDVSFELQAGTHLNWRWKIDALPSAVSETSIPGHDYLSVAVEFDNGRDLSFIWSHDLPVGTTFECPLPAWKGTEWHQVTRSGQVGLGRWHGESVDLLAAYEKAIGGPLPKRVVRVWLIANSLFQKREGRGQFAGIELARGAQRVQVD